MTIYNPGDDKLGGFTENDGTIDFYLRINSLIDQNSIVLDYGAGRGAWTNDKSKIRKKIRNIQNRVKKIYACDIDEAVHSNTNVDEILTMERNKVIVPKESFDLILADYVLEHIDNPKEFTKEIDRLLKPGGWFCARTPHKYNLVSIYASIIKNKFHNSVLKYIQPERKAKDVFPTFYKMNTLKELNYYFRFYKDKSFIYRTEPGYFFGNKYIYRLQKFFNNFLFSPFIGNLFIYKQKQL
tara:strand:+ start:949 stop:1668 length:720 start_codon:yes stop_codon:yes gene_type:complete